MARKVIWADAAVADLDAAADYISKDSPAHMQPLSSCSHWKPHSRLETCQKEVA